MGCSNSSGELIWFEVNESIPGQGHRTVKIAKMLGIQIKDLHTLFKAFVSFDKLRLTTGTKQQGNENVEEFYRTEQITTKEITNHLVNLFYSKSGVINFEEFVITCWWIVSLNEEEVAKWIFRLFDGDHDDKMTPTELKYLVQTLGSHNQHTMKELEGCYQHLCFEKAIAEQQHKPKGPLYYGQPMAVVQGTLWLEPMEPQESMVDAAKFTMQKKLFITLMAWTLEISKKPSVLKPIYEMQAMLREKTVGSRFFNWREFRQKTFGSSRTLHEILELCGIDVTLYKPQLKPHARTSGKGTTHRVFSATTSDKSARHEQHSESLAVVEEQEHTTKPHRFHADKRQLTPQSNKDQDHRTTTASAIHAVHNSSNRTPRITLRSNKDQVHERPTSATAAHHSHNSNNHTPRSNSRPTSASTSTNHSSHKSYDRTTRYNNEKSRPTSAAATPTSHNSHHNHTSRNRHQNNRATFPAPYHENDYRKIIDQLEGKDWPEVMAAATTATR